MHECILVYYGGTSASGFASDELQSTCLARDANSSIVHQITQLLIVPDLVAHWTEFYIG